MLNSLGELSSRTAASQQARDHHSQALAIARDLGAPLEEARALEGIGRCHLQDGHARDRHRPPAAGTDDLPAHRQPRPPSASRKPSSTIAQGIQPDPSPGTVKAASIELTPSGRPAFPAATRTPGRRTRASATLSNLARCHSHRLLGRRLAISATHVAAHRSSHSGAARAAGTGDRIAAQIGGTARGYRRSGAVSCCPARSSQGLPGLHIYTWRLAGATHSFAAPGAYAASPTIRSWS